MNQNNTYTVRTDSWKCTVNISNEMSDPYIEACIRSIQMLVEFNPNIDLGSVILCKNNVTNKEKSLNICKLLEVIGYDSISKKIRNELLNESSIDLFLEPISSSFENYE